MEYQEELLQFLWLFLTQLYISVALANSGMIWRGFADRAFDGEPVTKVIQKLCHQIHHLNSSCRHVPRPFLHQAHLMGDGSESTDQVKEEDELAEPTWLRIEST